MRVNGITAEYRILPTFVRLFLANESREKCHFSKTLIDSRISYIESNDRFDGCGYFLKLDHNFPFFLFQRFWNVSVEHDLNAISMHDE